MTAITKSAILSDFNECLAKQTEFYFILGIKTFSQWENSVTVQKVHCSAPWHSENFTLVLFSSPLANSTRKSEAGGIYIEKKPIND